MAGAAVRGISRRSRIQLKGGDVVMRNIRDGPTKNEKGNPPLNEVAQFCQC